MRSPAVLFASCAILACGCRGPETARTTSPPTVSLTADASTPPPNLLTAKDVSHGLHSGEWQFVRVMQHGYKAWSELEPSHTLVVQFDEPRSALRHTVTLRFSVGTGCALSHDELYELLHDDPCAERATELIGALIDWEAASRITRWDWYRMSVSTESLDAGV